MKVIARKGVRSSAFTALGVIAAVLFLVSQTGSAPLSAQCGPNPIVCENLEAGSPAAEWDISGGAGDTELQGFATDISVNKGDTVHFKVSTTAPTFDIDIYRLGYYGGDGARKMGTITGVTGADQGDCLLDPNTQLIDCGNWSESASWAVPSTAVSGVYIAKLSRSNPAGASHITFIVRDDASHSDLLMQTSDTTWQAYNLFGGYSLYSTPRATKVSYNRPFSTRTNTPSNFFFYAEYPMVRWLEANGYDVTYSSGVDTDRRGALLTNHKTFLSVGHDEYWSGAQRTNVEAARGAGVNLAFFSGNEVYWKTRWEPSTEGAATPYRTLVTYKETHENQKTDPAGPTLWTGTWRDPRFTPPADARPENALTGQLTTVIQGSAAITVPAAFSQLRFWRNTSIAQLTVGQSVTLADQTLGYEWDEDLDNGSRPAGLVPLSFTPVSVAQRLVDFGTNVAAADATHVLTLYRHANGALVFGAGTVQWTWGLDTEHDTNPDVGSATPDADMQQATVNLLADMGVQPATPRPGMVVTAASTDQSAPTSVIASPGSGASFPAGSSVTVSGTAFDNGGGVVGAVEVSVDGGATWHRAEGRESWSYTWRPGVLGAASLMSRAVDDSGNIETNNTTVPISITTEICPCTIWDASVAPLQVDVNDAGAIEVGVKFRADHSGTISALRFYKSPSNTGTHVGHLWTATGTLLGTATFSNETPSGWQQASFAAPVSITGNTTYVASYHSDAGHYSLDGYYFGKSGVNQSPLRALANGVDGPNGLFIYGPSAFPNQSFQAGNYWVDVVLESLGPDNTPPTTTSLSPPDGATGAGINSSGSAISVGASVAVTFSEAMNAATITTSTFVLRDSNNAIVPSTVDYSPITNVATLTPTSALAPSATYTATVLGGSGGVMDASGNAMASDVVWSFTTAAAPTCPCTIWGASELPTVTSSDATALELGVKFRADVNGTISGVRFYKPGTASGTTHTGSLWSSNGTQLATAVFANETDSGWQEVAFSSPVTVTANTTYIASYYAPLGNYAADGGYFLAPRVDTPPLHALPSGIDGSNGVYRVGTGFPTSTFNNTNYWVDVVFNALPPDTTPPTLTSFTPANGATGVSRSGSLAATFSEAIHPNTISASTFALRDSGNALVPSTLGYNAVTNVVTLTPNSPLAGSATYTATITGGSAGVKDVAGNALAATIVRSFTTSADGACPCTVFAPSATPAGAAGDTDAVTFGVELGMRFRSDVDGVVTGVRFYKAPTNGGAHVGSLWTNSGTFLASANFTNESASGWQQVAFSTPVAVTADTTYVVSYHTGAADYSITGAAFASEIANAPLRALANGVDGSNGVYKYGPSDTSAFPTQTFNATNYWVDVVFQTGTAPSPTVSVSATPPAVFGTSMEATVSVENGPANATDLLALFAAGDPDSGTRIDWKYLNGLQTAPPSGTNSATVTFMMPTAPGTYEVRLFPNGGATSIAASSPIVVGTPPGIGTQPLGSNVPTGQQAQLGVVPTGTAPFTYQWYAGPSGTTTNPVPGAISNVFTTPVLTLSASYWARVSSPWGVVDSSAAVLSVGTPPTVTTQPTGSHILASQSAEMSIVAAGSPTLTYQWYEGVAGNTVAPVAGAVFSTFTTPALTSTTPYWVRVTSPWGTTDSNTATVSIGTLPTITTQPPDKFIVANQTATMSVAASGTGTLAYQWYAGVSGAIGAPVAGAISSSFTTPALTSTAQYWVRVTSEWGDIDSTTATVSIGTLPVITTQPVGAYLVSGQQASLSVAASGPGSLSYQWYRGASGDVSTPVGTSSDHFTSSPLSATTNFWVRVSTAWGTADSNAAAIAIGTLPAIATEPANSPIHSGDSATLTVVATGSGTLTYQWHQGTSPVANAIAGATAASFTTPQLTNTTSYWVSVSSEWGTTNSATAVVSTPPTITNTSPLPDATAGVGYASTLQAANSIAPYTWAAVTPLPTGLSLSAGGSITGMPNAPGTTSFTVRVTGADSAQDERLFSLTVTGVADGLTTWHLEDKNVEIASANVRPSWSTTPASKGAGIVIGIVGDGLQGTHPDLQSNYSASLSHDYKDGDSDPSPLPAAGVCGTVADCQGTSAAGVAAAAEHNGLGGAGVAPLASLAGIRVTGAAATESQLTAAFGHQLQTIDILSNSWVPVDAGQLPLHPTADAAMATAIAQGRGGKGRIFVFAAGDSGPADNCNFDSYTNSRFGIAVGAVNHLGEQAPYSESCAALLVSAPSSDDLAGTHGLATTDLTGVNGNDSTDYTSSFGGTAAAAPVVSGVAALMLARNPALTWRDVQHIFVRSSRQVNANDGSWTTGLRPHSEKFGFGVVDALAAVNLAATWTNVAAESTVPALTSAGATTIPDNNPSGASSNLVVAADYTNFAVEHVEVEFTTTNARRGDLEVTLTSPAGVVSRLAIARSGDNGTNFTQWKFRSVRHWGETAAGQWTLKVVDTAAGPGPAASFTWTLRVYGIAGPPPPPPPPAPPAPSDPAPVVTPEPAPTAPPVSLAPSAPGGLTVSVFGSTVVLSWSTPASGAAPTTYILEAGTAPGAADAALSDTGSLATSYTAFGVGTGTYFVRIRAANGNGTSAASNEVVAVVGTGGSTPSGGAPAPPLGLVTNSSGSSVSLAWSRSPAGGAPSAYIVEAGSAPGRSDLANFSTGSPVPSFSTSGVGAGTYFVRVRAVNALGVSAPSNEATLIVGAAGALPCGAAPGAPGTLQSSVNGSTVTLAWSAASGAPTSYLLEAGSFSGGADIESSQTGNSATTLTAANVGPGTYFVRIHASNACGTGAASNEVVIVVR